MSLSQEQAFGHSERAAAQAFTVTSFRNTALDTQRKQQGGLALCTHLFHVLWLFLEILLLLFKKPRALHLFFFHL